MKILMVLESEFPPDLRVENEITALIEAGHEVHLACTTRKNRPVNDTFLQAIIHRRSMSSLVYKSSVGCLKFPLYFNFWRRFLTILTANEKFAAIHIHDLPLSLIGVELKNKFNIPLVIDLHENWPGLIKNATHTKSLFGKFLSSNSQWSSYERNILPYADKIIAVVEEAKTRITGLGIDEDKIVIVSNTVNIESVNTIKMDRSANSFNLFYGGGINSHRGLQIVIRALKILSGKNISLMLHVVGEGSYRDKLVTLANSLGISSNIRFYGYMPFKEMLNILAAADAAIIPHLRNENNDATIPHKLFQYMYLSKPVISSDCLPLKRIINETDSGFVYRNDSPEELADLLEKLVADRDLIVRKSTNGRNAVLAKYNWNFDKKRLTGMYRQLFDAKIY